MKAWDPSATITFVSLPDSIKHSRVSPTVFRKGGYRFYFFSREEPRIHVHVHHADGEAKFWLEPEIELAQNYGLSRRRITAAIQLIRRHQDEICAAWHAHFGG